MKVAQTFKILISNRSETFRTLLTFFILFLKSYGVIITLSLKNVKYLKITREN